MGISKYTKVVPIELVDTGADTTVGLIEAYSNKIENTYLQKQKLLNDTIANIDILRVPDKQYAQEKINELVNKLNQSSNDADLTSNRSVFELQNTLGQVLQDPKIQQDLIQTGFFRNTQKQRDEVMSNASLFKEAYDPILDRFYNETVTNYINNPSATFDLKAYPLKNRDFANLDQTLSKIPNKIDYVGVGDGDMSMLRREYKAKQAIEAATIPLMQNTLEYKLQKKYYFQDNPELVSQYPQALKNQANELQRQISSTENNLKLANTPEAKRDFQMELETKKEQLSTINSLLQRGTAEEIADAVFDYNFLQNKINLHGQVQVKQEVDKVEQVQFQNALMANKFTHDMNMDNSNLQLRQKQLSLQETDSQRNYELKVAELNFSQIKAGLGTTIGEDYTLPEVYPSGVVESEVPITDVSVYRQNVTLLEEYQKAEVEATNSLINDLNTYLKEDYTKFRKDLLNRGINLDAIRTGKLEFTNENLQTLSDALANIESNSGKVINNTFYQQVLSKVQKITNLNNQQKILGTVHSVIKGNNNISLNAEQAAEYEDKWYDWIYKPDETKALDAYQERAEIMNFSPTAVAGKDYSLAFYNDATSAELKDNKAASSLIKTAIYNSKYFTDASKTIYYPLDENTADGKELVNRKVKETFIGKALPDNIEVHSYNPTTGTISVKVKTKDTETKQATYLEGGKLFYIPLTSGMQSQMNQALRVDMSSLYDPRNTLDDLHRRGVLQNQNIQTGLIGMPFYFNAQKYGLPSGLTLKYNFAGASDGFMLFDVYFPDGSKKRTAQPSMYQFETFIKEVFVRAKKAYPNMSDNEIMKLIMQEWKN